MGADHARIFAEDLPDVTLRVACDASADRARSIADRYGAADVSTDPEAVIKRTDVDAVVVASPDRTHAPLSLACIRVGKPVLCEKPLSQSPGECLEVMAAEERAGRRFVQLGFMRRYDQSYIEMKAAVDDGSLGKPLMMYNFHRAVELPSADFTAPMAITSSAPHEFDVVRFVLGTEYASIAAFQAVRTDSFVAPVFMVLETIAGQIVTIEVNVNAAYGYDVRGEVVGETGSISSVAPVYSRRDIGLHQFVDHVSDWRPRFSEAYRRQDGAFLSYVRSGEFPAVASNAWDGYCAAVAGEAGVRALREQRKVPIETIRRPDFYAG